MEIVIRAGGVGSRLWPVSRKAAPKQFHAFTSEQTMLQEAVERVVDVAKPESIYISTSSDSAGLVQSQCPEVPQQNIIIEPARKDTAAAVGLESVIIAKRNPKAIVASLGSDHSVRNTAEFQRVLRVAEQFVQEHPEYIVPIGIQPHHPDTGYGYIQFNDVIQTIDGLDVREVIRFTEKPELEDAKRFLQEGNYLWNANMFVWSVETVLSLYEQHLPEMYAELMKISEAVDTPAQERVIAEIYPQLEKVAIDYAIIEKTSKIASVSASIGWNDIGDWSRLKDELAPEPSENAVVNADHIAIDTKNTLVYTSGKKKVIATIGVANLVIIETDDALLVAHKDHTQQVKQIVEQLEADGENELL
jgi:mannose-1-phosphate guanylyltransferase